MKILCITKGRNKRENIGKGKSCRRLWSYFRVLEEYDANIDHCLEIKTQTVVSDRS
jgi:hypothetical protein